MSIVGQEGAVAGTTLLGLEDVLGIVAVDHVGEQPVATKIARGDEVGQQIDEFQGIERKFAEIYRQAETAAALVCPSAAGAQGHEQPPSRLRTSTAKLYCSQISEDVGSEAVEIVGARAYQRGRPSEHLYRFARSRRVAAGTDEMQLNTVARAPKSDGLPAGSER